MGLGVYNAILLRPPGVAAPADVLSVYVRTPEEPFDAVSFEDYRYLRDNSTTFSGLAAYPFTIAGWTYVDATTRDRLRRRPSLDADERAGHGSACLSYFGSGTGGTV